MSENVDSAHAALGQPARTAERAWPFLLALLLAHVVFGAWNLHLQTIANPDEPRYACPARDMIRGGDWIVPVFNARPRLLKPIGFYWLIAATGAAGQAVGLGLATAMRLGPLLMGWLAVAATFLLGRRFAGSRCGLLAAGVLMTAYFFHQCSRELVVDMTLTACVIWAWLFVHIALARIQNEKCKMQNEPQIENRKSKIETPFLPLLGFYLCLGLACMTKGPVLVAVFVVVPLLAYLAWARKLSDLKRAGLWWGAPLAFAVGCWWFVFLWQRGYLTDIKGFFMTENVARAVGSKDHQRPIPFLFYLCDLGQNFAPWVILLPLAVWWTYKRWRGNQKPETTNRKPGSFLACALGVPFIILGIVVSKRALYLLPLYPLLALWLARMWHEAFLAREGEPVSGRGRAALWAFATLLLAAGATCGLLIARVGGLRSEGALLIALSHGLAFCGWAAARQMKHGRRWRASVLGLAMAGMVMVGFEAVARPIMERKANRTEFYRVAGEKLQGKPVVLLDLSSNEAVWYFDRPNEAVDDLRRPDLRARFFGAPGTKLLATEKILDKPPELRKALRTEPLGVMRAGETFVLADPDPENPPAPVVFKPQAARDDKAQAGDE